LNFPIQESKEAQIGFEQLVTESRRVMSREICIKSLKQKQIFFQRAALSNKEKKEKEDLNIFEKYLVQNLEEYHRQDHEKPLLTFVKVLTIERKREREKSMSECCVQNQSTTKKKIIFISITWFCFL
jgi:hypothetical protein